MHLLEASLRHFIPLRLLAAPELREQLSHLQIDGRNPRLKEDLSKMKVLMDSMTVAFLYSPCTPPAHKDTSVAGSVMLKLAEGTQNLATERGYPDSFMVATLPYYHPSSVYTIAPKPSVA